MKIKGFKIPTKLVYLIDQGVWPKNVKQAERQNSELLITKNRLLKITPDENSIYFYSPETFEVLINDFTNPEMKDFWQEFGATKGIQAEKCLIIGDFGLGSDSHLVLDFSDKTDEPCLKKLVWNDTGNYWRKIADTFEEFIYKVDL